MRKSIMNYLDIMQSRRRGKSVRPTDEDREEFTRLIVEEGWTSGKLARHYGSSIRTVSKRREEWGIEPGQSTFDRHRKSVREERIKYILEHQDEPVKAIAYDLGISLPATYTLIEEATGKPKRKHNDGSMTLDDVKVNARELIGKEVHIRFEGKIRWKLVPVNETRKNDAD